MGVCPITLTKFVGTFSLGLLTGTSYALSTLFLPTIRLLPSSAAASTALLNIQHTTTRTTLTLASISSLSLITAYTLAPRRAKHPYLLWTALAAFLAGQGVELFFNGYQRILASSRFLAPGRARFSTGLNWDKDNGSSKEEIVPPRGRTAQTKPAAATANSLTSESGFIEVSRERSSASASGSNAESVMGEETVNGEKVEVEMKRERKVQSIRTLISGIGFMMGVVGIWGDGA